MLSRLIDNTPVGRYTPQFAQTKPEWTFAPLYEGNFVKPFYNGSSYVESATAQEIAEFNKVKVPEKTHKAKFKLALIKIGISTSLITDYIYSLPPSLTKDKIIVLWEDTEEFYRNDKVLNEFAPTFNITQEQLDNLFILANTL